LRRGELWWADLGVHRPKEHTGKRPVVVCEARRNKRTDKLAEDARATFKMSLE
jgi:mRNA-degrading endonuclease toxin of MazEF toxin-antitoxin module